MGVKGAHQNWVEGAVLCSTSRLEEQLALIQVQAQVQVPLQVLDDVYWTESCARLLQVKDLPGLTLNNVTFNNEGIGRAPS